MQKAKTDEFKNAIQFATESGVMTYYSDGSFHANGIMTKGVFYKLLVLLQKTPKGVETLPDPDKDSGGNVFSKYKRFCNENLKIDFGECDTQIICKSEVYDAFKKIFGTFYKISNTTFPGCSSGNGVASRGWIAQQLYLFVKNALSPDLKQKDDKKNNPSHWHEFLQKFISMPRNLILAMVDDYESGSLMLLDVIKKNIEDNRLEVFLADLYTIRSITKKVYNNCYSHQKPYVGKAYHYTSLRALFNILKQTEEYISPLDHHNYINDEIDERIEREKKGYFTNRFYMCNAEFLNDPDEGMLILDRFKESQTAGESIEIFPKQQFAISLTTNKKEYLPMWSLYGDKGEGCRIEFEIGDSTEFKPVLYVGDISNSEGDEEIVVSQKDFYKYVETCIEEIRNILKNYNEDNDLKIVLKRWIEMQLTSIGYLFKTAYYSYEREIRYIKDARVSEVEIEELQDPHVPPRIHTYIDTPLEITEIRLGPKCMNAKQVAAVLKYYGIPKITKSEIHFQ